MTGRLTRHLEDQLVLLISFSAGSQGTALDAVRIRDVNPGSMARLEQMGLTTSKVVRTAPWGQRTIYWLTDAGVGEASRIRDARKGVRK